MEAPYRRDTDSHNRVTSLRTSSRSHTCRGGHTAAPNGHLAVGMRSIRRSAITLLVITSLSACGGGGSSGDTGTQPPPRPPPTQANPSPGGSWTVQYVATSGPNTGDTMQGKAVVTAT